jgi:galactokinase
MARQASVAVTDGLSVRPADNSGFDLSQLRERSSPYAQLGCEATDQLIELVRRHAGEGLLFGVKITGGGAGGTVAVLGAAKGSDAFERVVEDYAQAHAFEPGDD